MASDVAGPDMSPIVRIALPRSAPKPVGLSHTPQASSSKCNKPPFSTPRDNIQVGHVVEGVPHVAGSLDARQYKTPQFVAHLLQLIHELAIPSWHKVVCPPSNIRIDKVSGALTNAVFFVSSPSTPSRTLLLRIYGPSSGALIARPRELHILHVLSSVYRMGPRVYGTFDNGRIEEYFDSVTLTASSIRDSRTSAFIGARMAELHSVDADALEPTPFAKHATHISAECSVHDWIAPARRVLDIPATPATVRAAFDLDRFQRRWDSYIKWLKTTRGTGASRSVFCHNDAQYGNILRLRTTKEGAPEHHQIIVVDFEYAAANPAAYDIANHFHEWTANYHGPTPHLLDSANYPTVVERENFYEAYLTHNTFTLPSGRSVAYTALPGKEQAEERAALEYQVRLWSPVSHATWALWGLVQARDDIEAGIVMPEFDYIGYARCRLESFHTELDALALGF